MDIKTYYESLGFNNIQDFISETNKEIARKIGYVYVPFDANNKVNERRIFPGWYSSEPKVGISPKISSNYICRTHRDLDFYNKSLEHVIRLSPTYYVTKNNSSLQFNEHQIDSSNNIKMDYYHILCKILKVYEN